MATHAHASHDGREHPGEAPGENAHGHPSEWTYIKIALLLAVITVIEVAIYYLPGFKDAVLFVPLLITLSVIKFIFVVGAFMHLKFDDRRLTFIFGGAMILALSVFIALDIMMGAHTIDYATSFLH